MKKKMARLAESLYHRKREDLPKVKEDFLDNIITRVHTSIKQGTSTID